jgi:hypothetical protein
MHSLPVELFDIILSSAGETALYVSTLVNHHWRKRGQAQLCLRTYNSGVHTCIDGRGTIIQRIFRAACLEGLEELATWSNAREYTRKLACDAISRGQHALVVKIFPEEFYIYRRGDIDLGNLMASPENWLAGQDEMLLNMHSAAGRSGNCATITWAQNTLSERNIYEIRDCEAYIFEGLIQGGHVDLLNRVLGLPSGSSEVSPFSEFDILSFESYELLEIMFDNAQGNLAIWEWYFNLEKVIPDIDIHSIESVLLMIMDDKHTDLIEALLDLLEKTGVPHIYPDLIEDAVCLSCFPMLKFYLKISKLRQEAEASIRNACNNLMEEDPENRRKILAWLDEFHP